MNFPDTITIRFLVNERTGLLAALSDEIPGFTLTGRTEESLRTQIPEAVAAIIKEQYGVVVTVELCEPAPPVPGFIPMSPIRDWAKARIERTLVDA